MGNFALERTTHTIRMNTIFAFSGPIGSGKSSVSKLFASKIGATWVGFGATVKKIALERKLPTDRESLQKLGASLVKDEAESFCSRVVVEISDKPAVIDGLRHISILEALRDLLKPRNVKCIYVDTPLDIRLNRVKLRDGLTSEQLSKLGMHSTEIQVDHDVKSVADFVAANRNSVEECVDSIVAWTSADS